MSDLERMSALEEELSKIKRDAYFSVAGLSVHLGSSAHFRLVHTDLRTGAETSLLVDFASVVRMHAIIQRLMVES